MSSNITDNIKTIKGKISEIRPEANLVAVSKTHDADAVREAIKAGQRIFGENRVQEADEKYPELKKEFSDIELHLIGPLQSNKVKDATALFDVIQTVDREKLALELVKNKGITKEFFIQVNIGEEQQKAGIAPKETAAFYKFCKELGLNVTGLMCIPPVDEPPALFFALLRNLAKQINPGLKLSMGMSGDFEQALKFKADYIRVGSAIFGERPKL